jgi:hypothetical protein
MLGVDQATISRDLMHDASKTDADCISPAAKVNRLHGATGYTSQNLFPQNTGNKPLTDPGAIADPLEL